MGFVIFDMGFKLGVKIRLLLGGWGRNFMLGKWGTVKVWGSGLVVDFVKLCVKFYLGDMG